MRSEHERLDELPLGSGGDAVQQATANASAYLDLTLDSPAEAANARGVYALMAARQSAASAMT